MFIQKKNAQGVVELGADGKPIMIEVPDPPSDTLTRAQAEAIAREAADRARQEAQAEVTRERTARQALETQMAERERQAEAARVAALPAEQQTAARMTQYERDLAAARAETARVAAESQQAIRTIGLTAYRERALRDAPAEVHDLIGGNSEQEIDQSVDAARNVYSNLEAKLRAQFEAAHPPPLPGSPPPGVVPAPPQSPHYVAPPPPGGGFPTLVSPQPVAEGAPNGEVPISELTSEDAVRSGRYSGEVRAALHRQIKGNTRYPGDMGSNPRHMQAPMPQASMPGGVQQPLGTPTGPAAPPGQPHRAAPPAGAPPGQPPPPVNGARAQARAAVARTHAGGNPIVNGDSVAKGALDHGHAYLSKTGVPSPEAAFASRFTHTPPVTQ